MKPEIALLTFFSLGRHETNSGHFGWQRECQHHLHRSGQRIFATVGAVWPAKQRWLLVHPAYGWGHHGNGGRDQCPIEHAVLVLRGRRSCHFSRQRPCRRSYFSALLASFSAATPDYPGNASGTSTGANTGAGAHASMTRASFSNALVAWFPWSQSATVVPVDADSPECACVSAWNISIMFVHKFCLLLRFCVCSNIDILVCAFVLIQAYIDSYVRVYWWIGFAICFVCVVFLERASVGLKESLCIVMRPTLLCLCAVKI